MLGTYNFRAVIASVNRKPIRANVLFRSDSLDQIGAAGWDNIAKLNISTIIDLRTAEETTKQPSNLANGKVNLVHVPILSGSLRSLNFDDLTLEKLYITLVDESGEKITQAIQTIANAPEGVVVYCTAGKDRTGVVIALALAAIGVSDDEIVKDYSLTEVNLNEEWRALMATKAASYGITLNDSLRELVYKSPESTMRTLLAHLRSKYGTVANYLESIGITTDTQRKLQQKLIGK